MLHKDLKQNEQVVFKRYYSISEKEDYDMGNVIYVDEKRNEVCICYLEGYKSRSDQVPFEKVVARYNPSGEHLHFGVIHGPSELLKS